MIGYFACQRTAIREGRRGQAAALLVTTVAAILSLAFATVYVGHLAAERVVASNAADAVALSAATWEARGLNLIAALNDGIVQCLRLIRWTCLVWASLAVAAALGVGVPAFAAYTRHAVRVVKSAWHCARQLAEWSQRIRKAIPPIVVAETASLCGDLELVGRIRPWNPRGPHDGEDTLELHLAPGPPILLAGAAGPITKALSRIRKLAHVHQSARSVTGAIEGALKQIGVPMDASLRMLVPEEDLPKRQRVSFEGWRSSAPLPIPDRMWSRAKTLRCGSAAEVYGGGPVEMTWRSRLVEGEGR